MKYLHYTLICLLGLILGGCSDTFESTLMEGNAKVVGDKVILSASFDVPGFKEVTTRGFTDAPTLNDLNLYIIEFVDNGSPLTNTLSAVYRPSKEMVEGTLVKYDVTINKTDQPRILHFLALADENLQIPNGVEGSVMPGLTSEKSQDAYWRRLVFPTGYCVRETYDGNKERWVINQDLKDKLVGDETSGPKNIKLVRNFSKITVGIDQNATFGDANTTGFTLEGFLVVNTPLKGTMVPYSSTGRDFPEFLDEAGNTLPYQTVFQNYKGISPANTTLGNQVTSEDAPEIPVQTLTTYTTNENGTTKTWNCLASQYMYERPFSSMSRTYVIVRGKYHNRVTNPSDASSYYKLDLGANDANGIFRYFGLLRNFNFFIRITGIATSGYATAQAAAEGTVYNNISFDIDTDNLLNLSDGTDIIRVNMTTAVITDNDSIIEFRYAYKDHILGPNNGTYNNTLAKFIDLKPGSVIKSVTPNDPNTATDTNISGTPWRTVKIACNNPTNITQTQDFTIVNTGTGLGRTITLVSHLKWDFENLREFARIWENYPSTYAGLTTENTPTNLNNNTFENFCGTAVESQFTIFFDIPDNIPEALFPLEFTIESNLQGLENEPMGTIVVAPGPSLFEDNNGENRIQYRKSVTWTEYNSPLRMDVRDDNGTSLGDPNDGPVTHRVRCRFRTIETVTNNTEVTVRIDNINFNMGEVKFMRTDAANNLRGPGLVM
ncbi:MAG: hypothetical protein K2N48_10455 [Muribaculaceae bacterium]|nr:hypothetical protein [Muribaculaceae bacterium]